MINRITGNYGAAALLLLLLLLPALSTRATTVYRSVDENGVVSFTDTRPQDAREVETLEINTPPAQPDDLQQERLEAMRATTDRMAAERRAREKHRAELRQLQARSQPQVVEYAPEPPTFVSGFWGGRHFKPGTGHRPGHPVARPPLRPHPVAPRQADSRRFNEYPASLIRRNYNAQAREAFR